MNGIIFEFNIVFDSPGLLKSAEFMYHAMIGGMAGTAEGAHLYSAC